MRTMLSLKVNGEAHEVAVPVHKTLLEVLREDLGLTGTEHLQPRRAIFRANPSDSGSSRPRRPMS